MTPPSRDDFALGVFVTFLVAANVIDTFVFLILCVAISADAFVAAWGVAADCFRNIGTKERVFEAFIDVLTFFKAVALESVFARALDCRFVFWNAISILCASGVTQFWAEILDAVDSIAKVSLFTLAGKVARCVCALCVWRAIVLSGRALVDVDAFKTVAVISRRTLAGVTAAEVVTSGNGCAIVLKRVALVDVDTGASVALEAGLALALEAADAVDAEGPFAAVVSAESALVSIFADNAVPFVSFFTSALV